MNKSKRILIFLFTMALVLGMISPTVFAANVPVENMTLNVSAKTLAVGQSFQIKATITPSNATNKNIIWISSNPVVAEVSDTGRVTALEEGKTTIRATTEDGWIQRTVQITVGGDPVKSIRINKKHLKISWDDEVQLSVIFNPTYATNQSVTWTSSNPKIAQVDYDGWVWAEDTGTCYIYATTKDGKKKAKCKVTVYHTRQQLLEDIIFWTNEEAKSKLGYYMDSCDVDNTNPYDYDAIYRSLKEEIKAWMDELIYEYKGYQYVNEVRCGISDITISNYKPAKNSVWRNGKEEWGYNGSFDFKVNVSVGPHKMSSNTMRMRINTASLSHQVDWLINTIHAEPWLMEDYWVDQNYPVPTIEEFIDEWVQECVDYAQLKGMSYHVTGHTDSYKPATTSSSGHYNFHVSAANQVNSRTSGTVTLPIVPTNAEMRYLGKVMWAIYDYDEAVGFNCDKEDLDGTTQAANIDIMKAKIEDTLESFFEEEEYSDVKYSVRVKDDYSEPEAWKAIGKEDFEEGKIGILDFEIDLKKNNSKLTVEQMEFWIYDGPEYTARKWLSDLREEVPELPAKIALYKDEYEEFEYVLLTKDFVVPKGKTINIPLDETLAVERGKKLSLTKGKLLNEGGFLWIKGAGRRVGIEGSNYSEAHYRKSAVVPENPANLSWALENSKKIEVWDELTASTDFTIQKGQTLYNQGFLDLKKSSMTVKKGGRFINDAELCFWARGEKVTKPSITGSGTIQAAKGNDAVLWAADVPNLTWGWNQGFDKILVADDELIIPKEFTESEPFVIPKGKDLTISAENKADKEAEGVILLKGFLKIDGTLKVLGKIEFDPKFSYAPQDSLQSLSLALFQNPQLELPSKRLEGCTIPWSLDEQIKKDK